MSFEIGGGQRLVTKVERIEAVKLLGQQIYFVFPRANAEFLYTERSGMTRFDTAPLLIQELQLQDK